MEYIEQLQKRFEEAEKISEEEFAIDFRLYRIWPELGGKQERNSYLDVQIEKNYEVLQISMQYQGEKEKEKFQKIIKDIYQYYGVSEEDKKKESQRFLTLLHVLEEL